MSRRRSTRGNSSAGSCLAAIFFLVIVPVAAVKSCLFPSPTPASHDSTSYGSTSTYKTTTANPTRAPIPTTSYPGSDPEPVDVTDVHIPNPNLPGHGPHVHLLPHVHVGRGHHHF